ncbi:MAG: heparinase II/III family protein [Niabella sp.]
MRYLKTIYFFACLFFSLTASGQKHPGIMITREQVPALRTGIDQYPLLKRSYQEIKESADAAIAQPVSVPEPKDGGGGITHEQHKKNYTSILNCGIVYQLTGNKKYAGYVKDLLLQYASKYESWPLHPARKNDKESGRIFWQSLNDFVWQVYTIQGYDLVYDAIDQKDREVIENHLFLPILQFFTGHCAYIFNSIHNHGTWCLAAVGLTGYVLNKPEYVQMALKGSKLDGRSGYWAQLDQLFSPDGYYAEGPYYQRYALFPFLIFAKAIQNYQPQLHVFEYRNKLLAKAISSMLQCTYTNGAIFPLNDAIKDKTAETWELVYGVDIAYSDINNSNDLLDVAQQQGRVIVSDAGLKVAKAVYEKKATPFKYISEWLSDGADGKAGGLGILRDGPNTDQQCVVLKATTQGMGHGHFDRLNLLYYDNGTEVFSDYGAARFLNIESKGGGGYLPENNSWAKQTVAHNTLVVDRVSDFKSDLDQAQAKHPELVYFNAKPGLQVMSAEEKNAYEGVVLNRVTALITIPELKKPLLLDVFTALSNGAHQYDLPFWYNGQLVDASFQFKAFAGELKPMGDQFGYQHLWLNATTVLDKKAGYVTFLNKNRFYTTHFTSEEPLTVNFVTTGANDPAMNLTTSRAFMLSRKSVGNTTLVSITETHGMTDPVYETVVGAVPAVSGVALVNDSEGKKTIVFLINGKQEYRIAINYNDKNNFIKLK